MGLTGAGRSCSAGITCRGNHGKPTRGRGTPVFSVSSQHGGRCVHCFCAHRPVFMSSCDSSLACGPRNLVRQTVYFVRDAPCCFEIRRWFRTSKLAFATPPFFSCNKTKNKKSKLLFLSITLSRRYFSLFSCNKTTSELSKEAASGKAPTPLPVAGSDP